MLILFPWVALGSIKKTLKIFDDTWASQFGQLLGASPQRNLGALRSLVENRNQVAHGHQISATFNNVLEFYCLARNVVGLLERVLI